VSARVRPALLFGSVPGITPGVVRERGGHVRPERETCDALERSPSPGSDSVSKVGPHATRDEEVHAHIDSLALKRPDDRTANSRLGQRQTRRQRLAATCSYSPRATRWNGNCRWSPETSDQSWGLGRGLASEAARASAERGTLYEPMREIPAGSRVMDFRERRDPHPAAARIVGNSPQLLGRSSRGPSR